MILSHKYKFVCLNPQKTGTGFRETTLTNYTDVGIDSHLSLELRHWKPSEASNYLESVNKDPNDYYWFTFVRNPWERMISWMNMHQNFLLQNGESLKYDTKKFMKNCLQRHNFTNYIYRDGKLLDFIGSLENISDDFNYVLNKLDIHVNLGTRQDAYKKNFKNEIRRTLSQEDIKAIAEIEKEVIEMKKYTFLGSNE